MMDMTTRMTTRDIFYIPHIYADTQLCNIIQGVIDLVLGTTKDKGKGGTRCR